MRSKKLYARQIIGFILLMSILISILCVPAYAEEVIPDWIYEILGNLQVGANGPQVKKLQAMLNRIVDARLIVDGDYGSLTKNAVIEFQNQFGLNATGNVDDETRQAVNLEFARLANVERVVVRVNSYLHVRVKPNVQSEVVIKVYDGDVLEVLSRDGDWIFIQTETGNQGWVSEEYVSGDFAKAIKSKQEVYLCVEGHEVLYSPIVTGCESQNMGTPTGVFEMGYMSTDTMLMNQSFVSYWMNFILSRGIGFHDADRWRTQYGGEIYKYGGSHGCINMPYQMAERMFSYMKLGMTIVVTD